MNRPPRPTQINSLAFDHEVMRVVSEYRDMVVFGRNSDPYRWINRHVQVLNDFMRQLEFDAPVQFENNAFAMCVELQQYARDHHSDHDSEVRCSFCNMDADWVRLIDDMFYRWSGHIAKDVRLWAQRYWPEAPCKVGDKLTVDSKKYGSCKATVAQLQMHAAALHLVITHHPEPGFVGNDMSMAFEDVEKMTR